MDKLVEEIVRKVAAVRRGPEDPFWIPKDAIKAIVEFTIDHVLSAVRDGRLDEELGVVGRENVKTIVDAWLDEMVLMGATDFIALQGTGKEEA